MKTALLTIALMTSGAAFAGKSYTFNYQPPKAAQFQIKKEASTEKEAFKMAASECFQKLTNGKYPGEEKGLEIIDICANPKM